MDIGVCAKLGIAPHNSNAAVPKSEAEFQPVIFRAVSNVMRSLLIECLGSAQSAYANRFI
jgi:hypothetical protein